MNPPPFAWPDALVFWAVYVWALVPEVRILRRARGGGGAGDDDSRDHGSVRVMMVGMTLALVLAFSLAFLERSSFPAERCRALFAGGILLIVLGSLLRRYCWRTLGEYFTGDIRARAGQPVIRTGPYRLVRHPSYTGGFLMHAGIGLALCNWLSLGVLVVTAVAIYSYRVRIEERALLDALGEPYRAYMRESTRFVPYVI